jgi:hypothetical protein
MSLTQPDPFLLRTLTAQSGAPGATPTTPILPFDDGTRQGEEPVRDDVFDASVARDHLGSSTERPGEALQPVLVYVIGGDAVGLDQIGRRRLRVDPVVKNDDVTVGPVRVVPFLGGRDGRRGERRGQHESAGQGRGRLLVKKKH